MATDIIYCKYATGSDTVGIGNGTFENPYKTLNKALSVHTVGKTIGLLDNQPLASAETLPTYTSYVINSIIGVNDSGVADGTRRRIYGTGSTTYAFNIGATYVWSMRNIDFDTFSEYVFNVTANYSHRFSMFNFSISNCKGLTNQTTFGLGQLGEFVDGYIYNCSGGVNVFAVQSGLVRNTKFINCTATASILSGSNTNCTVENIVFSGCAVNNASYALMHRVEGTNIIIDRCACLAATMLIYLTGGRIRNLLLTHITMSAATKTLIYCSTTTCAIENVNYFDCVGVTPIVQQATIGIINKNVTALSSTPYQNDNGIDFTYKPSYSGRRIIKNIGEFTNVVEVL